MNVVTSHFLAKVKVKLDQKMKLKLSMY